ncbi:MAG: hypothetical protein KBD48_02920 [Candidatus Pacebacteria bacterium]|nr:hypothetical protein [Candidatus Paceibacterota bacterium]
MENRNCQNCKQNFVIEADDFSFYEKLGVPAPTWCPDCRFMRRLSSKNERFMYKRECGKCSKSIISMYAPESPMPVWCTKCHISDEWDCLEYGQDYDFNRSFFEQFKELRDRVPHRALDQNKRNGTGCEYANFCYTSKDIYLSFNVHHSENIKYSNYVFKHNKNCLDSMIIKKNEWCYELVSSGSNYNSSFLIESEQCIDSTFLYDCVNCTNCCMSSNLRNKSFVFANQQLTKQEYEKAVGELNLGSYSGQVNAQNIFTELVSGSIHKFSHLKNTVDTVGDFVENSKNAYHCFGLVNAENVKNIFFGVNVMKDSQDAIFAGLVEGCYEFTNGGGGASHVAFAFSCGGGSNNVFYSDNCKGCSDCFGCVSLNKKQYCIFNKQFTKEEYFRKIEEIKKHMDDMPYIDKIGRVYKFGEYFPTEISPFAYNETAAFTECPLSRDEVLSSGYRWKEMEKKSHSTTVTIDQIPDDIKEVNDDICSEIIACPNDGNVDMQCTSAYRILPDDLAFYRKMNLPIPRYCPNCRYHSRLELKNPFRFYKRACMCDLQNHSHVGLCEVEFETMNPPGKSFKVYCEKCYQQEVI